MDAAEAELGEWVAIVMGVPGESNSRVLSAESRRTAVVVSCICGRPPSVPIFALALRAARSCSSAKLIG